MTQSTPRRASPVSPLIRPVVYTLLGVLAVCALGFRWWFNPPPKTPPRKPPVNSSAQVALSDPPQSVVTKAPVAAPVEPRPASSAPPVVEQPLEPAEPQPSAAERKLRSVLNEARAEYVTNPNRTTDRFQELLQSIAFDLPEIQLSTEPGKVEWNKFTLFEHGVQFNAFRFTSPLDVPGDLFWCFATPRIPLRWYILPAEGEMNGFRNMNHVWHQGVEGLDLPRGSDIIAQHLLGGEIEPGKTYMIYFSAKSPEILPLRVAARVLPAKDYRDQEGRSERVLRLLGAKRDPHPQLSPGGRLLKGHTNHIVGKGWRPSGELISVDYDGDIYLWDIQAGVLKSKTSTGLRIDNAVFDADGRRALFLDFGTVMLWDIETNAELKTFPFHEGKAIHACIAPDQNSAYVIYETIAGQNDYHFDLVQWSLENGEDLASHHQDGMRPLRLLTTPQGPRVAGHRLADPQTSQAVVYDFPADLKSAPAVRTYPGQQAIGMSISANQSQEIIADWLGIISIIDPADGKLRFAAGLPDMLQDVCFLSDPRYAAVACKDGAIKVYDLEERQICLTWTGHEEMPRHLILSPDGKTLVSLGLDCAIGLWDAAEPGRMDRPRTIVDSQGHELKPIAAGEFKMGTFENFRDHEKYVSTLNSLQSEEPQHWVRISRPFYLASKEVSVEQFHRFVNETGYQTTVEKNGQGGKVIEDEKAGFVRKPELTWRNPGHPQPTDRHPVVQVTREDALAYCEWLSKQEQATYRLPTEAEWELACGGNLSHQRSFVPSDRNYERCANLADYSFRLALNNYHWSLNWQDGNPFTAEVGSYFPNKFGLHDMLGNVWELCQDQWSPNYQFVGDPTKTVVDPIFREGALQVRRGGSFYLMNSELRSGRREPLEADEARVDVGFRVLREIMQ